MALSIREAVLLARDQRNTHVDRQLYPANALVYVSVARISGTQAVNVAVQVRDVAPRTAIALKYERWVTILEDQYHEDSDESAVDGTFRVDPDMSDGDAVATVRVVVARIGDTTANTRYRVSVASKST